MKLEIALVIPAAEDEKQKQTKHTQYLKISKTS